MKKIEKNGKHQYVKTGHNLNWSQRFAIMAGGAFLSTMMGMHNPAGMVGIGGAALAGDVAKNSLLSTGKGAQWTLNRLAEHPFTKFMTQVGRRIPGLVSQAQSNQ